MVGPGTGKDHGNAKRVRHTDLPSLQVTTMTTITCDKCGHEYAIQHRFGLEDTDLAARQAAWLADNFVWDHIQENKHQGSIRLPFLAEAKVLTATSGSR